MSWIWSSTAVPATGASARLSTSTGETSDDRADRSRRPRAAGVMTPGAGGSTEVN